MKSSLAGVRPDEGTAPREGTPAASDPAGTPSTSAWMGNRRLELAALLILLAVCFYVASIILSPFLTAIFLAFVLAIAFDPLHRWISKRVRGTNTTALLTTVIVMLCILIPCILISVKIVTEAASIYNSVSQQWQSDAAWYKNLRGLSDAFQRIAERTGIPVQQLKSAAGARSQELGSWLVERAGWAARGLMQQLITAILVFLVLFFLVRDHDEFERGLFALLPLPPRRVMELTTAVHESIVANVYGMFAVGLVQGVLTGLGFWMTGLGAPLLWGAVAMVFSFVPLVGPSLVWFPACILLAGTDIRKAILLFIWGAVVVSAADYIIRPRIAGGSGGANRLLVLLSFLGGVKAFGIIGIFVGPVILALIISLLRILHEEQSSQPEGGSVAA